MLKSPTWTTVRQLQVKITKLERDKELLRSYLHELIEAFYKTVNKSEKQPSFAGDQKANSSNWTLNPDLENLLKGLSEVVKSCPNCFRKTDFKFSTFGSPNFNEGNWEQIKDIFSKMKGTDHE